MSQRTIIVIPARMASTRFPGKVLADIHGQPMIAHVYRLACEANLGPVMVACDDFAIVEAVNAVGGMAVMTLSDLPSGSDRVYSALCRIGLERFFDVIVNVQADMPMIDPAAIREAVNVLKLKHIDIGTIAAPISDDDDYMNDNIVKVLISDNNRAPLGYLPGVSHLQPYFSRQLSVRTTRLHRHVGVYAYRQKALAFFASLEPTVTEKNQRLEQLRALENEMRIGVALVDKAPIAIDAPDDIALLGPEGEIGTQHYLKSVFFQDQ